LNSGGLQKIFPEEENLFLCLTDSVPLFFYALSIDTEEKKNYYLLLYHLLSGIFCKRDRQDCAYTGTFAAVSVENLPTLSTDLRNLILETVCFWKNALLSFHIFLFFL